MRFGEMSGGFTLGLWIALFLGWWFFWPRETVVSDEDIKEFLHDDTTQVEKGGASESR